MTLVSPGVEVTVVDESAYGSPGTGTIPLLLIATQQDKADPTNSSAVAAYTTKATAGQIVRVTSKRELTQYFGNPQFTTVSNAVVQGSETSEYGLMTAYSYLGQGNQAFIVRADVDLAELEATTIEPTADWSTANTIWLDTDASSYGIHVYNSTTNAWEAKTPIVEITNTSGAAPTGTSTVGTYKVLINTADDNIEYYKDDGAGDWETIGATLSPHYSNPAKPSATITAVTQADPASITATEHGFSTGDQVTISNVVGMTELNGNTYTITVVDSDTFTLDDIDSSAFIAYASGGTATKTTYNNGEIWVKTTSPGNGINLSLYQYTTAWSLKTVQAVSTSASTDITDYVPQNGSSATALTSSTAVAGNIVLGIGTDSITIYKVNDAQTDATALTDTFSASVAFPTATAADGQVWYDDTINSLDMYVVNGGSYDAVSPTYATEAPTSPSLNDVWVDTSNAAFGQSAERIYPVINVWNGVAWIKHDNTDQTTERGVLFADISDTAGDASTVIDTAPDPLVYPDGMIAVNMAQSKNTVRVYDATAGAWRNGVSNHSDGSGRFGRFAQRQYVVTKLQAAAASADLREEQFNFTLMCAPNYPELTDELVNLNSDRGETAFIIIDTPMRKNPTEAVNWIQNVNVASENSEDGLVTNNTYSAVYYPACTTSDPVNGRTIVMPPSHMALYTYAYNDNISYVWFPPAGTTRGVVQNASAVGYLTNENEFKAICLTQGQRDAMYTNKMNPIVTFIGTGTIVYGQKTMHPETTALDRVNVARLVAYLRERFDDLARPFLFEINDQQTRDRAKLVFDRFLADILSRRGIYDFAVVCDESNNTPARIDRNELYIDIAIEPAKAVEFIYIPIRIVNTGTLATTV